MSGMVAALTTDEDLKLTEDEISWIVSTIHLTSVCGFAVAGVVTNKLGHRRAISVLTTPILANWILLYYAHSFISFLISRIIVGVCYGGVFFLVFICTSEYTAPNIRGVCLSVINTVGTALGNVIGHVLSFFFHWRIVALLGLVPTLASILLPYFWVESPHWLASKGMFDECRKSYKALHGHRGEEAEKELRLLIELEKSKNDAPLKNRSRQLAFKNIKYAIRQRYFWKLALLKWFMNVYRVAAGITQYTTLAINMIQDITGKSDVLLYTIYVDLFFLAGSVLSCILMRKMKMLTLFFSTAWPANLVLLLLSAGIYFQSTNSNFSWINASLLALYLVLITSGPYAVLDAVIVEMPPSEIKAFFLFSFSMITKCELVLSFKLIGPMYHAMGYHGIFLLNAAIISLSLVYLRYKMPETKGRTLQEIEIFVKTGCFENKTQLLKLEEQVEEL